jgi:hypothetical protein
MFVAYSFSSPSHWFSSSTTISKGSNNRMIDAFRISISAVEMIYAHVMKRTGLSVKSPLDDWNKMSCSHAAWLKK